MLFTVLFFGGFVTENKQRVCFVISLDLDDSEFLFTHFTFPNGIVLTTLDFKRPLKEKTLPVLHALFQRKIKTIHYDSDRTICATVNNLPFDMHLLGIRQNIHRLFEHVQWWGEFLRRKNVCRIDMNGKQTHPTWKCECGQTVSAHNELCPDQLCPSWNKYLFCTAQKPLKLLSTRAINEN